MNWDDIVHAPVYVVNLDRQPQRLTTSIDRIRATGFNNVSQWKAVDGQNTDDLVTAWVSVCGIPKFDPSDEPFASHPYKQGIFLSHITLWKHIMEQDAPYTVIFEDDVVFHKDWHTLAPAYYDATPKDYDVLYMGHHCGYGKPSHILNIPVFCLQAMIVTKAGAAKLYNKILGDPAGVSTIDVMLFRYMCDAYRNNKPDTLCTWYCWNGEHFPDDTASKYPEHAHKDQGLVFQEWKA